MKIYKVCRLSPDQIIDAQRLLYRVYGLELDWQPIPGNLSNMRYEDGRCRDDFENTAIWFGAFHKNVLIGCLRVITGDLEASRYAEFPVNVTTIETNRMCIEKAHRKSTAIALMTLCGLLYCIPKGYKTVYGTVAPQTARRLLNLGWKETGIQFKYDKNDPEERVLLSLDISRIGIIKYALRSIRDWLKRNSPL